MIEFLLACALFGLGFVILAYVIHDVGWDLKKRRTRKELDIKTHF